MSWMSPTFEPHIHKLTPELFSFGHALIPDDLQAQQIVIDAVAAFAVEHKELLARLSVEEDKETQGIFLNQVKRQIYRNMFQIGKRRCEQLRELCHDINKFQAFYRLPVFDRAVLFLKQKVQADFSEIEFVTGVERLEIISRLNYAREELVTNSGHRSHEDMIPA